MEQARASPQTRHFKVLGLLALPLLCIVAAIAVMVLASFLTQPSTVHAADIEGMAMDQAVVPDLAAVPDGIMDLGDQGALLVVDQPIAGQEIKTTQPSAITDIDGDRDITGLPSPSTSGETIATSITVSLIIGTAAFLGIAIVTTAIFLRMRRREVEMSTAASSSQERTNSGATVELVDQGEKRQHVQASSQTRKHMTPVASQF